LLLQFYHSNLVGYSTETILNKEILLDLNLKLLNNYLLSIAAFIHPQFRYRN